MYLFLIIMEEGKVEQWKTSSSYLHSVSAMLFAVVAAKYIVEEYFPQFHLQDVIIAFILE